MPTSSQQKTPAVFCDFLQIRNICERADVDSGPYDYVFRHAEAAYRPPFCFSFRLVFFSPNHLGSVLQHDVLGKDNGLW